MMKQKIWIWLCALALCLTSFPGALAQTDVSQLFSAKDLTLANAEEATQIVLNNQSVVIDQEGTYVLSGTIDNGSVRVALATEGTVYLLLNGVAVRNESGAALYTENCKKVVLTLAENTVNTFSQGSETPANEEEEAAVFSRDDLTVNGAGALVVNGEYKDGINCRDTLKMVSGNVTVTAADDGLVGKDAVIVGGGTLNIGAVCDGIKATNDEDAQRGYVTLAGGAISIVTTGADATGNAVSAEETGNADAPELPSDALDSARDSQPPQAANPPAMPSEDANAPADTPANGRGGKMPGMGGGRGGMGGGRGGFGGFAQEGNPNKTATSAKGVKAVTTLTVCGANLAVESTDDALHANDVLIESGVITLASGDDGVHADNALTILGGQLAITRSYEGLEGAAITIAGGEISLAATDDGVNGAGGDQATETDGVSAAMGFGGWDRFSTSAGTVTISGGTLRISASGDGLDVNGSLTMSGGEVYINGPTNAGNGALDYDGTFTMTGGTLVAVGASGMAMGVSDPSVAGVAATLDGTEGSLLVKDANGSVIISMEANHAYQSAVIYSELLQNGATYTLVTPSGERTATMSVQGSASMGWR